MTDKIQKLIDSISELSVLNLSELVKALEEKFGVSAQPLPSLAGPAGPATGGEAGAGGADAPEQSVFTVVLTSAGTNKIAVIKALREINPQLGLKEAKDLSEKAGAEVVSGVNKATAEETKTKLTAAGATVELK